MGNYEYNKPYYEELLLQNGFDRAMTMWSYYSNSRLINEDRLARGAKIVQGKIAVENRLGTGYFKLPENLDEGYYRFRAFTLSDLQEYGSYYLVDIPVYSEWKEDLTVYKDDQFANREVDAYFIDKLVIKNNFVG